MSQNTYPAGETTPDSAAVAHLNQLREKSFKKDFLRHANIINKERTNKYENGKTEVLTYMVLKESALLNCLVLKEDMQYGPLIENMDIVLSDHGTEVKKMKITTVGPKRLVTFPALEVSELSFIITAAKAKPHLGEISGYLIDEKLFEKE